MFYTKITKICYHRKKDLLHDNKKLNKNRITLLEIKLSCALNLGILGRFIFQEVLFEISNSKAKHF